jgi:EAL domain-containing protein (putative c-di-GMP-specific phosphodiesterase class I)
MVDRIDRNRVRRSTAAAPAAGPGRTPRVVRGLTAVVAVECLVGVLVRGDRVGPVLSGRGRPVDYLAVAGLGWLLTLAVVALVASRHVRELGRLVTAQGEHLAATEEPRRRRAAAADRTHEVLSHPDLLAIALQPVVGLADGRWSGCEALARFPGEPAPDRWFAEAHDAGLGVSLELLAVRRAVTALACLPAGVGLSVNASPALVLDPAFAEELGRCDDLDRMTVEITEHAAVARYEDIADALAPHRARGLRLAVDDTGAGYASFAHVLRLRPDVVKLDRSLLADIDHDAARRAFVTAVVLMALELAAEVTAEGVETPAELETLCSLGVDAVQGYLLARPSTEPAVWASWATRDWAAPGQVAIDLRPRPHGVTYG